SLGAVAMAQNPGQGVGDYCKPLTEQLGVNNDLCVNRVNPSNNQEETATCICKNSGVVFPGEVFLGYPNLARPVRGSSPCRRKLSCVSQNARLSGAPFL